MKQASLTIPNLLEAHFLGTYVLRQGDTDLAIPATTDARLLLGYLLLHPKQAHPRLRLIESLWPNSAEGQSRRRLSRALWHVRRCLPNLIHSTANQISLDDNIPIWVDVTAFEALASASLRVGVEEGTAVPTLHQAIQLYRGPLLDGYYDEWVLVKRDKLEEIHLQVLQYLLRHEKAAGHYREALAFAQQLVEADPLRETSQREFIQLLFMLGHPETAVKQYEKYRQQLEHDLRLKPAPQITALVQQVASQYRLIFPNQTKPDTAVANTPSAPLLTTKQMPLIGRHEERTQLLEQVEAIFAGAGGTVLLEGEAGVGKTRLLQEIAQDAEWRGAQVLWGKSSGPQPATSYGLLITALESRLTPLRVQQMSRLIPKPMLQVLRPLLPSLQRYLPNLSPPAPLSDGESDRLQEAFIQLISGWSTVTPLLLILEDTHWIDADTGDMLPKLATRLAKYPVLIIIAYRSAEMRSRTAAWDKLRTVDRTAPRRLRLRLNRLDANATTAFLREALAMTEPSRPLEQHIYQETDGNPLFILETLRTLRQENLLQQDEQGTWRAAFKNADAPQTHLPLSQTVEQAIAQRLQRLAPSIRHVLEATAVLGMKTDFSLLSQVMTGSIKTLLASLHTLVQMQLLEETEPGYRFSHDKIQQVAYAEINEARRRQLHQQAAQAIAQHPTPDVISLAYHYTQGQLWDQAVIYHLQAAERAAAVHGHRSASDHYTHALELLNQHAPFPPLRTDEFRFQILTERYKLIEMQGKTEQARQDVMALSELAERLGDPERQIDSLNAQAAFLCHIVHDYAASRRYARHAQALAQMYNLPRQEMMACYRLGNAYFLQGYHREAIDSLQQALGLWKSAPGQFGDEIINIHFTLAQTYQSAGESDSARAEAETLLAIAHERNMQQGLMEGYLLLGQTAFANRDLAKAAAHFQACLQIAHDVGDYHYEAVQSVEFGLVYWAQGNFAEAADYLQKGLALFERLEDWHNYLLTLVNLGQFYLSVGQHEQAADAFLEATDLAQRLDMADQEVRIWALQSRLYTSLSNVPQAQLYADKLRQALPQVEAARRCAQVHFHLGYVCQFVGEWATAVAHFQESLPFYEDTGKVAMVYAHLAACHHEMGQREQAISLSQQAVHLLESQEGKDEIAYIYWQNYLILKAAHQEVTANQSLQKVHDMLQADLAVLPDVAWQRDYLENVPVHRAIMTAYEKMRRTPQPGQIVVYLPKLDAALGRPLRDDEMTTVIWTQHAPEDKTIANKVARRRHRLQRLLAEAQTQDAIPAYHHLAEALAVSTRTIERDMAYLQKQQIPLPPTRGH